MYIRNPPLVESLPFFAKRLVASCRLDYAPCMGSPHFMSLKPGSVQELYAKQPVAHDTLTVDLLVLDVSTYFTVCLQLLKLVLWCGSKC